MSVARTPPMGRPKPGWASGMRAAAREMGREQARRIWSRAVGSRSVPHCFHGIWGWMSARRLAIWGRKTRKADGLTGGAWVGSLA